MKKVAGTQIRGGNYYLNLRIPTDLRDHFGGKLHLRESLGTSDAKVAEREVMLRKAKFHELQQEAERRADVESLVKELPEDQRRAFEGAGGTLEGLLGEFQRSKEALAFGAVGQSDYDDERPRQRLKRSLERAEDEAAQRVLTSEMTVEGKTLRNLGEKADIPGGDVTGMRELAEAYFELPPENRTLT